jgi:REP element-mobilizing transposase RayT
MKERYGNRIHGYVIMPNHLHLLLRVTSSSPELSVLIMNAKRPSESSARDSAATQNEY